ncbi:MAG TPA: hypothetical protein VFG30_23155 [Polyangiales bacterium]|nr:hypothetical protein [Polyangiales bacterium]
MKAFLSLLVAASVSSFGMSLAAAQDPRVHLVWERPVGSLCPSRAALEADVEEVMGRRIFTEREDAPVIVHGVIEDGSTEAHVRIDARSKGGVLLGTRELTAPAGRCSSLRGAIALVLTLFVDRDEGDASAEESLDTRIGFGISGEVVSTPLPRTTFAAGPTVSLEVGPYLRFQADGAYWVPVSIQTQRGVGARLGAFSFRLRICAKLWGDGTFGLRACAGAEAGALVASPLELAGPPRQTRLLAHGMLDLGWETRLGRFALIDLAAGPLLSFSRPRFSYVRENGEPMAVYRPKLGGIIFQLTFIILGS